MRMQTGLIVMSLTMSMVVSIAAQTNTFPASGNTGVGTTSPLNPFVVYSSTYSSGLGIVPGCDNSDKVCITGNNGGNRYFVIDDTNKAIQLWTNNAQTLTINSSGDVGIGTTIPYAQLDVEASGQGLVNLLLKDPSTTDHLFFLPNASAGYANNLVQAGDQVIGYTGNSEDSGNLDIIPWSAGYKGIRINSAGNVGIGTTSPGATLEVNGNVKLTANSGASMTFQDGTTQSTAWTGVLCGGDYAEAVDASGDRKHYGPGDVLVLGPGIDGDVEKSAEPYSTMVAGIFATKPGVVGRRETLSKSAQEIPMAMVGIVPTKVSAENGPIRRGDLLVTSSVPGYAMKGTDRMRMLGAVIGKAMGSLDSGTGVIEVLVTLQ